MVIYKNIFFYSIYPPYFFILIALFFKADYGLSGYTLDNLNSIKDDMKFCIDEAVQYIPLEKRASTYIGLAATAGMRLLE